MGEFSLFHILMVLGIVLLFFGPSRLPSLGNSLGKAIRGFKDGLKDLNESGDEKPTQQTLLSNEKLNRNEETLNVTLTNK